jgi:hypothetical protein
MIIRQSAFEGTEPMLKGNLHCHTDRSDGWKSPEGLIRYYAKNGYDFLALTDHRYYNRMNLAPDVAITIIPGMEFDAYMEGDATPGSYGFRCYHTVCIGVDDESNTFEQDAKFKSGDQDVWCPEDYQKYLDWIRENNNLPILCHPQWSGTPLRYFENHKGYLAMEIWNSICAMRYDYDVNAPYWDEALGKGMRIWGVASDDAHESEELEFCKGWILVRSENNVPAILDALKKGNFYSTTGPVIWDFYVEDRVAHLKCSPCRTIQFISEHHISETIRGTGLTHGEQHLIWSYHYIRATVMDEQGRRAWTNPIFFRD